MARLAGDVSELEAGGARVLVSSNVDDPTRYTPDTTADTGYEESSPIPASPYVQLSSPVVAKSTQADRIPSQNADFKSSYSPCGSSRSSMAGTFNVIKEIERGAEVISGVMDHGLLTGLSDDDHLQYLLLAGRSGGQIAYGGTAGGEILTLRSTSHTTKGHIYVGPTEELRVNDNIRMNSLSASRDPVERWSINLIPTTLFTKGVDRSDSDKLKISNTSALGTLAETQGSFGESLFYIHSSLDDIIKVDLDDFATDTVVYNGTQGTSEGQFGDTIKSITTDGSYVYVSDPTNNWISKFDVTSGAYVGKCAVSRPWGICYWGGTLYVVTNVVLYLGIVRLHHIDAETMTVSATYTFDVGNDDDEFNGPRGMCTDGTNLFICDAANNRIKKTTLAGVYVSKVGSSGSGNGQFGASSPVDCEVDGDYLYVCDYANDRIEIFDKGTLAYVAQHGTQTVGSSTGAPSSIAINDTYYYIGCNHPDPEDGYFEKYDIATRSFQAMYNPFTNLGDYAGSPWSAEIVKFATSTEKLGDLWVLHQDGSYLDTWPICRFVDDIRLVQDGDVATGDYVGLRAPAAVGTSYTLTFPADLPAGQSHVSCSSAGVLSFGQDVNTTASPTFVRLTLTQAAGTAPMTITSTTVVTNLNSDLWDGYHQFMSTTGEPTGFVNRTGSTLSWNDGNRTLTITGTNFIVWYNGVAYTLNTDTKQITDTTGLWYFYYEVSGATLDLTASQAWPGFNVPLVATVYWNTVAGMDKGLVADERHGIVMDQSTHEYLHETVGCRYESGLAGTFADATFSVAAGYIHDEDVDFQITPAQTACDVLYLDGSADWKWLANQTVYYYTSGGNLYWNNGTTLTAAGANKYVAVWIFATTSPVRPIVSIIGQVVSGTITDARLDNKYESLSLGTLPFKEMKLLYRVILRNDVAPYEETQDLRSVSNLSTGTYVATAHNTLTGLTTGDDHTQYAYCKISATDSPGVDDDTDTYREGTVWVEQDANAIWICADNTDGAAVWHGFDQDLRTADSPNFAGLSVGTNDVARGLLYLYGHEAGGAFGGTLVCHTSADHDGTISNYGFMVKEDDLLIGPDTNVDALLLDANDDLYITGGSLILPASEYVNFGGTLGAGGYGIRDNAGTMEFCNSGGAWTEFGAGGGAAAFLDLTDVDEADYTGHAAEFVVVNGDEDGLEFSASSVAGHDLGSANHTDVDAAAPNDDDILRFNSSSGNWEAEALPAAANHDLLSATHSDTTASAVTRGSIIVADSTPKWAELAIGTANYVLQSDGTDAAWASPAHALLSTTWHSDVVAQAVTRGSIIYGNATPKWDELTIGTSGYVLASDGTDVAWALVPTHASRHQSGGADAIKLDDLAAPDDNTDLDVSASAHGLAPKRDGSALSFLSGAGTWVQPGIFTLFNESFDSLSTAALHGQGSYTYFGAWASVLIGTSTINVTAHPVSGKMVTITGDTVTEGTSYSETITSFVPGMYRGTRLRCKMRTSNVAVGTKGIYIAQATATGLCQVYFRSTDSSLSFYNGSAITKLMDAVNDTWYQIDVILFGGTTAPYATVFIDGVQQAAPKICGAGTLVWKYLGIYCNTTSTAAAVNLDIDDIQVGTCMFWDLAD